MKKRDVDEFSLVAVPSYLLLGSIPSSANTIRDPTGIFIYRELLSWKEGVRYLPVLRAFDSIASGHHTGTQ